MNIWEWAWFNKARVAAIYITGIIVGVLLVIGRERRRDA